MGQCFPQDFGVLACAQKISHFGKLNNVKVKTNQRVPSKNADMLKKLSLMGTEEWDVTAKFDLACIPF